MAFSLLSPSPPKTWLLKVPPLFAAAYVVPKESTASVLSLLPSFVRQIKHFHAHEEICRGGFQDYTFTGANRETYHNPGLQAHAQ